MKQELDKAVEVLKSGGIILYPTDTIWGIGCDASNEKAVKRIYEIKKRSDQKSSRKVSGQRRNMVQQRGGKTTNIYGYKGKRLDR